MLNNTTKYAIQLGDRIYYTRVPLAVRYDTKERIPGVEIFCWAFFRRWARDFPSIVGSQAGTCPFNILVRLFSARCFELKDFDVLSAYILNLNVNHIVHVRQVLHDGNCWWFSQDTWVELAVWNCERALHGLFCWGILLSLIGWSHAQLWIWILKVGLRCSEYKISCEENKDIYCESLSSMSFFVVKAIQDTDLIQRRHEFLCCNANPRLQTDCWNVNPNAVICSEPTVVSRDPWRDWQLAGTL